LIIDYKQVAVRSIDIAQAHIYGGNPSRRIHLHERRRKKLSREVVIDSSRNKVGREVTLWQSNAIEAISEIKQEMCVWSEGRARCNFIPFAE
jgi:hypothetical protein